MGAGGGKVVGRIVRGMKGLGGRSGGRNVELEARARWRDGF